MLKNKDARRSVESGLVPKHESLFNLVPDPITVADTNSKIVALNDATEDVMHVRALLRRVSSRVLGEKAGTMRTAREGSSEQSLP